MTEINPHGKIKLIPVENWGKKYNPVRVWCCIVAILDKSQLLLIQQSWGKYCDKLLFFIGDNRQENIEETTIIYDIDQNITLNNVVRLKLDYTGVGLARDVWEKCWKMYQYLYVHHFNEFDWIIRADMDAWFSTYNFKGFAQYFNPNKPWWFGHVLTNGWRKHNAVFHAGGTFALSREVIRLLNRIFKTVEFLNNTVINRNKCQNHRSWRDDVDLAFCLKTIGVFPINSLDEHYRMRWSVFTRKYMLRQAARPDYTHWFYKDRFERSARGDDMFAEHMIQYHYFKDKAKRNKHFKALDKKHILPSMYNWKQHPIPLKPTTFLFNTSFTEIDEFFNIEKPPRYQKIWKGVDNLWEYVDK